MSISTRNFLNPIKIPVTLSVVGKNLSVIITKLNVLNSIIQRNIIWNTGILY